MSGKAGFREDEECGEVRSRPYGTAVPVFRTWRKSGVSELDLYESIFELIRGVGAGIKPLFARFHFEGLTGSSPWTSTHAVTPAIAATPTPIATLAFRTPPPPAAGAAAPPLFFLSFFSGVS